MKVAFFLAVLTTVAQMALYADRATSPDAASLAGTTGTDLSAGAGQKSSGDAVDPYRALLDALGAYPGTVQIREYVLRDGRLGRMYATGIPLEDAAELVTDFYESKLLAQGWDVLDRHAAVSSYVKGNLLFLVSRSGPTDPGERPEARLLKSAPAPAGAKFFCEIEAGPRPR